MSEYTPTTAEVRAVWSVWSGYGGLTNRTDDVDLYGDREAEFDHWLNQVKADAWGEGYRLGAGDEFLSQDWTGGEVRPARINPYREAGQ